MEKIIYFGFFLLKTNYTDLNQSIRCTLKLGYPRLKLLADMLYCSFKYGSSFVDYFNFNFYNKSSEKRGGYASMGTMYTFHNKINDKNYIDKVDDKKKFYINFADFCNKAFLFNRKQHQEALLFLNSRIGNKVVLKNPESTAGKGVMIFTITVESDNVLIGGNPVADFCVNHFRENEFLYFEDYIEQHPAISNISPTGVNTIRMITLINNDGIVEIIGSVFRISVNCSIDNYSAGNLAAEIDKDTGIVVTGGIRKRSSCDIYHNIHPVTGRPILGFIIPYWEEVKKIVIGAAMVVPQVRTVGWDIAITQTGPVIIEGNSKWNKDTWQIPAGYGKLEIIKKYL